MTTRRPNGVITPDGNDAPNFVKSMVDLGLTSNRFPSASSQAAADRIVESMRATAYPASVALPVYVLRTDLEMICAFDGSKWINVGTGQAEWESLSLWGTWRGAGGHDPKICMRGGVVTISGAIVSSSSADYDNICQIPQKYRPSREQFIGATVTAGGDNFSPQYAELRIQSNGWLGFYRYSTITQAEGWIIPIAASYIPW